MPKYMYREDTYPTFVSGGAYVMSFDAAIDLYEISLDIPITYLEDAFITGESPLLSSV